MKIKITLYFLIFFACPIPSNAQDIALGLPQMNVIYIGINNEVTIAVNGYATKSLVYETINCEIIEKEGKRYLRSYSRGLAQLKVGVKLKGNVKWLETYEFRVRMIPSGEMHLGTISNGEVHSIGKRH